MNIIKRTAEIFGYDLINMKHQASLTSHLRNLLRRCDVNLVIDAGANRGQFGKMLRRLGYHGEMHSFEPVSAPFENLKKSSANDRDWYIHKLALGDADGEAVINVAHATRLSSILEPSEFGRSLFQGAVAESQEAIKMHRLDTLFSEGVIGSTGRNIFLKMDTQGFDLKVFNGARDNHDDVVCLLSELSYQPIYEGMPSYLDTLRVYGEAGFRVTGLFPVTRNEDLSVIEMDCVLVKGRQP